MPNWDAHLSIYLISWGVSLICLAWCFWTMSAWPFGSHPAAAGSLSFAGDSDFGPSLGSRDVFGISPGERPWQTQADRRPERNATHLHKKCWTCWSCVKFHSFLAATGCGCYLANMSPINYTTNIGMEIRGCCNLLPLKNVLYNSTCNYRVVPISFRTCVLIYIPND